MFGLSSLFCYNGPLWTIMDHNRVVLAIMEKSIFSDVPELEIESPKLKFVCLNYGTTSAPCLTWTVPDSATPPPCTPSPEMIDQVVATSPVIQPQTSSKSLSPFPYLKKGKYCTESPDSPTTSHFAISLPPPTHVLQDFKLDLASTTKIEADDNSPQLSTPDERLFSDPPMSDSKWIFPL